MDHSCEKVVKSVKMAQISGVCSKKNWISSKTIYLKDCKFHHSVLMAATAL